MSSPSLDYLRDLQFPGEVYGPGNIVELFDPALFPLPCLWVDSTAITSPPPFAPVIDAILTDAVKEVALPFFLLAKRVSAERIDGDFIQVLQPQAVQRVWTRARVAAAKLELSAEDHLPQECFLKSASLEGFGVAGHENHGQGKLP